MGRTIGYDTLAAEVLFHLRDTEFLDIKVVLENRFEGVTSRWDKLDRKTLPRYNERVCVAQKPFCGGYFARDRYMVDHSNYCSAYCT